MMRWSIAGLAVLLLSTGLSIADETAEPPYRINRPADRVLCFNPGTAASEITTCVIETDGGLVVIDTGISPAMGARTRARIEAELDRDDIRWVINTHSHFDHTSGNQFFSDAVIIGHENALGEMQAFYDGRKAWLERRRERLQRLDSEAEEHPDGSPEKISAQEGIEYDQELISSLETDYRVTAPTLTFSDRLGLTVGDLDLELVWMGSAHTRSDIVTLVPDLGVCFTGDLFFARYLGVAAFAEPNDTARWIDVLGEILDDERITVFIGGHGFLFTRQWIEAQRRYLIGIAEAVGRTRAAGADLDATQAAIPFDERFDFITEVLGGAPDDYADQHRRTVEIFWRANAAPE